MPSPPPPPPPPQSSLDAEFYRYYEPLQDTLRVDDVAGDPIPSPDKALTAFAQLATYRLGVRRCLISFFDTDYQYILAEATRSLLLSDDDFTGDPGDTIHYGARRISREGVLCNNTVNLPTPEAASQDVSVFIVPDLREDPMFASKPCVTSDEPYFFYAGVPIRSPSGFNIGSYCVIDDQPRASLSPSDIIFLKDMATTVMLHLDHLRAKYDSLKAVTMLRGLSCLVAKSDPTRSSDIPLVRPNLSYSHDWAGIHYLNHHTTTSRQQMPSDPDSADSQKSTDPTLSRNSDGLSFHVSPAASRKDDTLETLDAFYRRAAATMRSSLDCDGAAILRLPLDTSVGPERSSVADSAISPSSALDKISEESAKGYFTKAEAGSASDSQDLNASDVLGSALKTKSDNSEEASSFPFGSRLHRSLLRYLVQYYPSGQILSMHEFIELERTQTPDIMHSDSAIGRRRSLQNLRSVLPDWRSLIFMPVAGKAREADAIAIAWHYDRKKSFASHPDLTYLHTFCNSLFAEVFRIEIANADRAKTNFISSISHELRSPLHGLMCCLECLHGTPLNTFQSSTIDTAELCGRTLLDSIDHLLHYTKINSLLDRNADQLGSNRISSASAPLGTVDMSMLLEEILETAWIGHTKSGANIRLNSTESLVETLESVLPPDSDDDFNKIRVGLEFGDDLGSRWTFSTQRGPWSSILMNLIGNSFRYTTEGFVHVKVNAEPAAIDTQLKLVIDIVDSGEGMTDEYLRQCFTPFTQENTFNPGLGLGLPIVSLMAREIGAELDMQSKKHGGTAVRITATMGVSSSHRVAKDVQSRNRLQKDNTFPRLALWHPETIKIPPFDNVRLARSPLDTPVIVLSSVASQLTHFFPSTSVRTTDHVITDKVPLWLVLEDHFAEFCANYDGNREDVSRAGPAVPVLVLTKRMTAAYVANVRESREILDLDITPFGARKLLRTIESCEHRQTARPTRNSAAPATNLAYRSNNVDAERFAQKHRRSPEIDTRARRGSNSLTALTIVDASRDTVTQRDVSSATVMSARRLHVLVVEDNKINMKLLVTFLKKQGHSYVMATDGLQAYQTYQKHMSPDLAAETSVVRESSSPKFDCIITDVSMPVMDGLESTRLIRDYERRNGLQSTLIVAVTGVVSANAEKDALESGVNVFLTKPLKFVSLQQTLDDAFKA